MGNKFSYGDITYGDLQAIDKQQLSGQGIKANAWADAAATAQLIPIAATEFRHACAFMPIIFSPMGKPFPIAITSFTHQHNSFVHNSAWDEDTYIPLAMKRYPFALAEVNPDKKRLLCIDHMALEPNHPSPLFDQEGNNNSILTDAITQCKQYDKYISETETVIDAIEQAGLFVEKQLTITNADGHQRQTSPFKIIDTQQYAQLNEEQIITLHKKQALWIIHAHFISMNHIRSLAKKS